MIYILYLILYYVSLTECYQIRGHAEITAGGDKMVKLIGKYAKHIRVDDNTLRDLWNTVKNVDIEILKPLFIENATTGPSRSGSISNYPLNYPNLSMFTFEDLEGSIDDKMRFLKFVKNLDPVYKMLISSLNKDYYERHRRSYPLSMMAQDFIQIASHFNVIILKNGGRSYGLDWRARTKRFNKRTQED